MKRHTRAARGAELAGASATKAVTMVPTSEGEIVWLGRVRPAKISSRASRSCRNDSKFPPLLVGCCSSSSALLFSPAHSCAAVTPAVATLLLLLLLLLLPKTSVSTVSVATWYCASSRSRFKTLFHVSRSCRDQGAEPHEALLLGIGSPAKPPPPPLLPSAPSPVLPSPLAPALELVLLLARVLQRDRLSPGAAPEVALSML